MHVVDARPNNRCIDVSPFTPIPMLWLSRLPILLCGEDAAMGHGRQPNLRRKSQSRHNLTPTLFSASVRQLLYASWIQAFDQVTKTDHNVDEPASGHIEQNRRYQRLHRLTMRKS